jgi:arylsulfatase A-like enzyme
MALVRRRRPSIALLVGVVIASSGLFVDVPRLTRPARAAARAGSPNVLVIVTDDQRADSMKMMSATRRLIRRRGVKFPYAYTTTPTCCPARASIFTGRYPHNHEVRTNDGTTTDNLDHTTTLQAYLQEAGYRTALFGKYLNGWNGDSSPPYFDRWAFFSGRARGYYFGNQWNIDGKRRFVNAYSTRFIQKKTLEFIGSREARKNPWLTFVTTAAPHAPFTPQEKYLRAKVPEFRVTPAMTEEDRTDKPAYVQEISRSVRDGKRVRKGQLRTLLSVDDLVASVFEKLRRTGQASNTIVFFLSDNGYMHSEHGLTGKTAPYLPSVQIPMLLRAPGRIQRGATDERMVANIDIAPTVMDAVGLEPPEDQPMDGRSLLDPTWKRDRLLLEYFRRIDRGTPEWGATLTKEDQYVEYYEDGGRINATFREYYNLLLDPHQLENSLGNEDPADDPLTFPLRAQQLDQDRNCRGTTGDNACP